MLNPDTILNNRYRIVRLIAEGGMGAVYEAIDQSFGHSVALKQLSVNGADMSRAFEREAQLMAALLHPTLPKMLDHFNHPSGQFLVMEYILGDDLGTLLAQRGAPFPVDVALGWADQILDALAYMHGQRQPVVHRDLKPQNLKLTPDGRIMMLDFGLSKGAVGYQTRMTGDQSTFGFTAQYAPLEQIQGAGTDPRSDLYALAATLYHLLTGVPPASAMARMGVRLEDRPDPLRPPHTIVPTIPASVSAALIQALDLNPGRRPATAEDMRAMLQTARTQAPQRAVQRPRPWLWPAIGGGVVFAIALLILLLWGVGAIALV